MTRHIRLGFIAVAFILSCSVNSTLALDLEHQVKAAFIYRFCAYVQWPDNMFASQTSPFVIAIAGTGETVKEFENVFLGKLSGDRPLVVKHIRETADLDGVHIFYLERDGQIQLSEFPAIRNDGAILTITEDYQAPDLGIINFVLQDGYVRFEVAKTRADAVGLQMSSELLAVASKVK